MSSTLPTPAILQTPDYPVFVERLHTHTAATKGLSNGVATLVESLKEVKTSCYRTRVTNSANAARLTIDQAISDFNSQKLTGQLRFSTSVGQGRFIFETTMDPDQIPASISVGENSYKFESTEIAPKDRVAIASILNLPLGVTEKSLTEALSEIGQVISVEIPDFSKKTHKALGSVVFSHIHNRIFLDPKFSFFEIPDRDPVVIKFANYVLSDADYFLTPAGSKAKLLADRALEVAKRLLAKRRGNSSTPAPPTTPASQYIPLSSKPSLGIITSSTPKIPLVRTKSAPKNPTSVFPPPGIRPVTPTKAAVAPVASQPMQSPNLSRKQPPASTPTPTTDAFIEPAPPAKRPSRSKRSSQPRKEKKKEKSVSPEETPSTPKQANDLEGQDSSKDLPAVDTPTSCLGKAKKRRSHTTPVSPDSKSPPAKKPAQPLEEAAKPQ